MEDTDKRLPMIMSAIMAYSNMGQSLDDGDLLLRVQYLRQYCSENADPKWVVDEVCGHLYENDGDEAAFHEEAEMWLKRLVNGFLPEARKRYPEHFAIYDAAAPADLVCPMIPAPGTPGAWIIPANVKLG